MTRLAEAVLRGAVVFALTWDIVVADGGLMVPVWTIPVAIIIPLLLVGIAVFVFFYIRKRGCQCPKTNTSYEPAGTFDRNMHLRDSAVTRKAIMRHRQSRAAADARTPQTSQSNLPDVLRSSSTRVGSETESTVPLMRSSSQSRTRGDFPSDGSRTNIPSHSCSARTHVTSLSSTAEDPFEETHGRREVRTHGHVEPPGEEEDVVVDIPPRVAARCNQNEQQGERFSTV